MDTFKKHEPILIREAFPFAQQFLRWLNFFNNKSYVVGAPQLPTDTYIHGTTPLHKRTIPVWDIPTDILNSRDLETHMNYFQYAIKTISDVFMNENYLVQDLNWLYRNDWDNPLMMNIANTYSNNKRFKAIAQYNIPFCFAVNKDEQRLEHLHNAFCHVLPADPENMTSKQTKPFHHSYGDLLNLQLSNDKKIRPTQIQAFQQMENAMSTVWDILSNNQVLFHTPILLFNTINDNGAPILHIDIAILESNENTHINYPRIAFDDGQASPLVLMARLALDEKQIICHDGTTLLNTVGYTIPNFTQHSHHILNVALEESSTETDFLPILYKEWDVALSDNNITSYLKQFDDWQPYSKETGNALRTILNHAVEEQVLQLQADTKFNELKPHIHWLGNYDTLNEQQFADDANQAFHQHGQQTLFTLIYPSLQIKLSNEARTWINKDASRDLLLAMKEAYSFQHRELKFNPLGLIKTPCMYIQIDLLKQFEQDFGCLDFSKDVAEAEPAIHPIVLNSPLAPYYEKLREMLRNGVMPTSDLDSHNIISTMNNSTAFFAYHTHYNSRYLDFVGGSIPFVLCNPNQVHMKKCNSLGRNDPKMMRPNQNAQQTTSSLLQILEEAYSKIEIILFATLVHAMFGFKRIPFEKPLMVQDVQNIVQFVVDLTEVRESHISQTQPEKLYEIQKGKDRLYQMKQELNKMNANDTVYFVKNHEPMSILSSIYGVSANALLCGDISIENKVQ